MNEEERIKHIRDQIKKDPICQLYASMDHPFSFKEKKMPKEKVRLTFEDTLRNQKLLMEKLETLIKENRLLYENEKNDFMEMFCNGLLGVGENETLFLKVNGEKVPLGTQCEFIKNMLNLDTDLLVRTYNKTDITIGIGDMWKVFLEHVKIMIPKALSLCFH